MRRWLLVVVGAILALTTYQTRHASAQGISVGPGGVSVDSGYGRGRGDGYGRGEYRGRGEHRGRGWRGERRGPRVIVVPRRNYYDRY